MEKYAIFGIIKVHYNIVETRPSNVNCGNINAIAIGPAHAWPEKKVPSSRIYESFHIFFWFKDFIGYSLYKYWSFLNGDASESAESRENTKNPAAKYYLQWGWNPGPLSFRLSMFLSELIHHLLLRGSLKLSFVPKPLHFLTKMI